MDVTTKKRTVQDKMDGLDLWERHVDALKAVYATDEWKDAARAAIAMQRKRLAEFAELDPGFPLLSLTDALASDVLSSEEKMVVRWQHRHNLPTGDFWKGIFDAVTAADDKNMERLIVAFPDLAGIHRYRREWGYSDTLRGLPIDFDL